MTKLFNRFSEFPIGDTEIEMLSNKDINAINAYLLACADINKNHHSVVSDEFTDFYLDLNKFIKLLDYYDETFSLYVSKKKEDDCKINLFCIDPSEQLKRTIDQVKGKIFFSATLSPSEYYIDIIGRYNFNPMLFLPSPFDKKNLKLLVAPNVSIRYKRRQETLNTVVSYIKEFVSHKVGNYFIYVPSYEYLEMITPLLMDENYELLVQERDMKEEEKTAFLS